MNIEQTNATIKLGWVHVRIISMFKGLTKDQLDGRRKAGKFVEGYHWMKDPTGAIMWHYEALDAWIEGKDALV